MAKKMKKLHVKVRPLKLEGLPAVPRDDTVKTKLAMIEVKWKGPVSGFVLPFYRSNRIRNSTRQKPVTECHVGWDEEFEHDCSLVGPWDLSFKVLYGERVESKHKLPVIGKASLNLSELTSMKESTVDRKLPVPLKGLGIAKEATLVVSVSFAEARNELGSAGLSQNLGESERLLKVMKSFRGSMKKANGQDESAMSNPSRSPANGSVSAAGESSSSGGELSPATESSSSSSPETRSDQVHNTGFLSWKRRRLSFSLSRRRESLVHYSDEVAVDVDHRKEDHDTKLLTEPNDSNDWVLKELVSRDGKSKLKSKVYFASFDQRSEEAAGESACTAVVVVTAHWLHANPKLTPSRSEFDSLITRGSSLWQTLCNDESFVNSFPDKHFDLETVISANLRPLRVCTEKSFTGFFSPEKFDSLKGLMSFDQMWDEIEKDVMKADHDEFRVYIMSWNDHFFVLEGHADGYYIIDSLGERLFEGCKEAYILKFDDSSLMYEQKVGVRPEKTEKEKSLNSKEEESEEETIICSGKECCREYIKRFLAGITVAELEAEEEKGTDLTSNLHRRLQVDLHYTDLSVPLETHTELLPPSS